MIQIAMKRGLIRSCLKIHFQAVFRGSPIALNPEGVALL